LIAAVASVILLCCDGDIKSRDGFHGMWRLDRHEMRDSISNTWSLDSSRVGLTGFVVYDGLGHMGVQQIKAPGDTSQNNIDIVYFAKYILLENSVIQHTKVSSSFDDVGAAVRRRYEFRGDTLLLSPQEAKERLRVVWIKVSGG
jgi:hypothetical protein